MAKKKHNPLPGFGLTLGFTLFYLSVIVLIPLGGLVLKSSNLSWVEFWKLATTERAWYRGSLRPTPFVKFFAEARTRVTLTQVFWPQIRDQVCSGLSAPCQHVEARRPTRLALPGPD